MDRLAALWARFVKWVADIITGPQDPPPPPPRGE